MVSSSREGFFLHLSGDRAKRVILIHSRAELIQRGSSPPRLERGTMGLRDPRDRLCPSSHGDTEVPSVSLAHRCRRGFRKTSSPEGSSRSAPRPPPLALALPRLRRLGQGDPLGPGYAPHCLQNVLLSFGRVLQAFSARGQSGLSPQRPDASSCPVIWELRLSTPGKLSALSKGSLFSGCGCFYGEMVMLSVLREAARSGSTFLPWLLPRRTWRRCLRGAGPIWENRAHGDVLPCGAWVGLGDGSACRPGAPRATKRKILPCHLDRPESEHSPALPFGLELTHLMLGGPLQPGHGGHQAASWDWHRSGRARGRGHGAGVLTAGAHGPAAWGRWGVSQGDTWHVGLVRRVGGPGSEAAELRSQASGATAPTRHSVPRPEEQMAPGPRVGGACLSSPFVLGRLPVVQMAASCLDGQPLS